VWYRIKEGDYFKFVALRTVEGIDQDDPGKAIKVAQPRTEFFIDNDRSPNAGGTCGLDWHTGGFGKG
jgi:hypothetical protein